MGALRRGAGLNAGGALLAAATRAIAWLRPAAKPLHPVGVTLLGHLDRRGSNLPSGVQWLDEPGRDEVLVRLSRAVGLPTALPDIHGLAVRVLAEGAQGDLLLASTGWGRVSRFVLTFGMHVWSRPLTTLLPYRTPSGAVILGARAAGPQRYELSWATYDGQWQAFAELVLSDRPAADQQVSFDPVRNQVPGLEQYPFVAGLREPAYLTARRSRG